MAFRPFRGSNGLNLNIQLQGLLEAQQGMTSMPIRMNEQFSGALRSWATDVMARSKALVPVATGTLRESGQVTGPEMNKGALEIHLGYGDRQAWYAAIVHERLDVRHPRGQAKYLETPINEGLKSLDDALGSAIARAFLRTAA